jgi:hypothetical protein
MISYKDIRDTRNQYSEEKEDLIVITNYSKIYSISTWFGKTPIRKL